MSSVIKVMRALIENKRDKKGEETANHDLAGAALARSRTEELQ